MKICQGIKVLVVGPHMSGKTSLVQSLVDQQSRVVPDTERSLGVDFFEAEFDLQEGQPHSKNLQLAILDFAGHDDLLFPHYLFLQVKF